MPSPSQFSVSSEAADLWRPNGDRLSFGDAAWCGASFGIVMHAALNFFSVAIPSLEGLLVVFAPAQWFAFAITSADNPLGRWLALIVCQGIYWAIVSVVLLSLVHGATDLVRGLRLRAPRYAIARTELVPSDPLLEQGERRRGDLGLAGG